MTTELMVWRCTRCGSLFTVPMFSDTAEKERFSEAIDANPCPICERGKGQREFAGVMEVE